MLRAPGGGKLGLLGPGEGGSAAVSSPCTKGCLIPPDPSFARVLKVRRALNPLRCSHCHNNCHLLAAKRVHIKGDITWFILPKCGADFVLPEKLRLHYTTLLMNKSRNVPSDPRCMWISYVFTVFACSHETLAAVPRSRHLVALLRRPTECSAWNRSYQNRCVCISVFKKPITASDCMLNSENF